MIVFHNTSCSKSCNVVDVLSENKVSFQLRDYIEDPINKQELSDLLQKLGCKAIDIIRTNEPLFLEKFKDRIYTEDEWITILEAHPELLQRPILIEGNRAIIGRPVERVISFVAENPVL